MIQARPELAYSQGHVVQDHKSSLAISQAYIHHYPSALSRSTVSSLSSSTFLSVLVWSLSRALHIRSSIQSCELNSPIHECTAYVPTPANSPLLTPATFKVGLTLEEKKFYSQLFKALDPEGSGIVTGEKARSTFEKSGLPPNILGEIWQLADASNLGFLTQFGFCYAMRLIGHTQAGHYPTAQLADSPGPMPQFSGLAIPPPLVPQGTSSSLLQSQPSAIVPQNTATQQAAPLDPVAPVSPADYERFAQMYVRTTGLAAAPLDGAAAKNILMKAKLPTITLGQVWSLVDVDNRGFLDLPAFVMAMHLIHGVLSGAVRQLPPFLPEYVWLSVDRKPSRQASATHVPTSGPAPASSGVLASAPAPAPSPSAPSGPASGPTSGPGSAASAEWVVSDNQKQQVDSIFDSLDKAKTGSLNPDQVASFLMTSRLDQHDLATIWDLADIQNTGVFTKIEFGIALFLVNRRRAGLPLPNVVPPSLLESLQQQQQPPQARSAPPPAAAQPPPPTQAASAPAIRAAPKSSLDELADLFASPEPSPKPALQQRTSSSDLTHAAPTKVKKQLTSSFRPTSSFGQSLLARQVSDSPSLIGEDVVSSPTEASTPEKVTPQPEITPEPEVRKVDYGALRAVPPPKPRQVVPRVSLPLAQQAPLLSYFDSVPTSEPRAVPSSDSRAVPSSDSRAVTNSDLLADSEVSGKLSEATSDIANVSNQIKSLTTQTSSLHEKKVRADQELARILAVKGEIDNKLKLLRTSYANEVKQVEQVEATLSAAKEETEALRSEASIAEAKLNHVSGEFHEKQLAVEEHQKINSSLREKLGYLNAEIAELEKQALAKASDHLKLSNEANVRKSQVQVALVKVQEWKDKIAELEASYFNSQREAEKAEQDRLAAEAQSRELEAQSRELESKHAEFKLRPPPVPKLRPAPESSSSSDFGKALAAAAAGAAAIGAGVAYGSTSADNKSAHQEVPESRDVHNVHASTAGELEETQPQASASEGSHAQIPGSFESGFDTGVVPDEEEDDKPPQYEARSVPAPSTDISGLVDEVQDTPVEDMTGVDDFAETKHKDAETYDDKDLEGMKERFPEVPYEFNHESTSSAATASYKPTETGETGETPATSPDNSEYRFQSPSAGIAGGMVGMPGVLVGVQRTDSLTSSIQNNPPMSVRDDNIEEISDRETLEETAASPNAQAPVDHKDVEGQESSEGERISSGVELFEMVNADDARDLDTLQTLEGAQHPLAQSHRASTDPITREEEEFPPIKELDYDDSSSSEEEDVLEEKFDDAVDNLGPAAPIPVEDNADDFNDDFDDLKPATQEKSVDEFDDLQPTTHEKSLDDFFEDEFNDLRATNADVEGFEQPDLAIDDHFTGAEDFGDFAPKSTAPDFSAAGTSQAGNDEWEQLFAGFGNAAPAPATPNFDSSKDGAIEELVGMGFERETVIEALDAENWNVEAATNYLLDRA